MNPRRRRGTGTIQETRDGRFRARLPGANGAWLPLCDTYEEAAGLLVRVAQR